MFLFAVEIRIEILYCRGVSRGRGYFGSKSKDYNAIMKRVVNNISWKEQLE
jgi:hypothetical protein